jgi:hypothetical protein
MNRFFSAVVGPTGRSMIVVCSTLVSLACLSADGATPNLKEACSITQEQVGREAASIRARRAVDILTQALIKKKGIIAIGSNVDEPSKDRSITIFINKAVIPPRLAAQIPKMCVAIPVVTKESSPFKAQ